MRIVKLLFVCCLLISCQDNEEPKVKTGTGICLGTASSVGFESCETAPFVIDQFCDSEFVGSFNLLEDSYEYLPMYCESQNSTFVFTNLSGDSINLVLSLKRFSKSKAVSNTFVACDSDPSKTKSLCIDYEAIRVELNSSDPELSLLVTIRPELDVSNRGIGDFLTVSRSTNPGSLSVDFSSVLNQRTLSYAETFNQEYYETLKLNTVEYTDVMSNDVSNFQNPIFKYYFNKEKGLIGFVDTNDVVWTLAE